MVTVDEYVELPFEFGEGAELACEVGKGEMNKLWSERLIVSKLYVKPIRQCLLTARHRFLRFTKGSGKLSVMA